MFFFVCVFVLLFRIRHESASFNMSFVGKLQACIVSVQLYNLDHTSATVRVALCFLLSTGEFQLLVAAVWFSVDLPHVTYKAYAPEGKLHINLKFNFCLYR